VIVSFGDGGSEALFNRRRTKRAHPVCPVSFWPVARRKLDPLNAAISLQSLRLPTHPGAMLLEEFLKPLKLTQTEVAKRLGIFYPRLNEIIHGKRGVTPDTALRLERAFGMEAQFWLNLQQAGDLYHALHSPAASDMDHIERIPALAG